MEKRRRRKRRRTKEEEEEVEEEKEEGKGGGLRRRATQFETSVPLVCVAGGRRNNERKGQGEGGEGERGGELHLARSSNNTMLELRGSSNMRTAVHSEDLLQSTVARKPQLQKSRRLSQSGSSSRPERSSTTKRDRRARSRSESFKRAPEACNMPPGAPRDGPKRLPKLDTLRAKDFDYVSNTSIIFEDLKVSQAMR